MRSRMSTGSTIGRLAVVKSSMMTNPSFGSESSALVKRPSPRNSSVDAASIRICPPPSSNIIVSRSCGSILFAISDTRGNTSRMSRTEAMVRSSSTELSMSAASLASVMAGVLRCPA